MAEAEIEVDKRRDELRSIAEQCAREYRYEACTTPKRNKNNLMVGLIFKALEEVDSNKGLGLSSPFARKDTKTAAIDVAERMKKTLGVTPDTPEPKFQEGNEVRKTNDNRIGIVKSSSLIDDDEETYFYYNIFWVNGVECGIREDGLTQWVWE